MSAGLPGTEQWHPLVPGRVYSRTKPYAAGNVCIVFHGRLFAEQALPAGLSLPQTASPERIVAAMWEAGGTEALDRLRGYFVVAVAGDDQIVVRHDDSGMERLL